jgi:hypothetical protein
MNNFYCLFGVKEKRAEDERSERWPRNVFKNVSRLLSFCLLSILSSLCLSSRRMDRLHGRTNNDLYAIKLTPKSGTPNFNAVWQWGLLGQISAQFSMMSHILNEEVPRPGVSGLSFL